MNGHGHLLAFGGCVAAAAAAAAGAATATQSLLPTIAYWRFNWQLG
jgi:hypothetical protein